MPIGSSDLTLSFFVTIQFSQEKQISSPEPDAITSPSFNRRVALPNLLHIQPFKSSSSAPSTSEAVIGSNRIDLRLYGDSR
ncbi:hypothetical protein L1987_38317 [Smallanthus sonchifolius]|uniref:Uncharacterized protein n=1 Tax=Smallanthus sonchifolius TaxID=185202 RepID=A0ACB9HIU8_9ASTR|nr:hypothetical protein L1987_38317 [Smallanthus sonchifolius]